MRQSCRLCSVTMLQLVATCSDRGDATPLGCFFFRNNSHVYQRKVTKHSVEYRRTNRHLLVKNRNLKPWPILPRVLWGHYQGLTPAPHGCVFHALRCDPSQCVHACTWTYRDGSQRNAMHEKRIRVGRALADEICLPQRSHDCGQQLSCVNLSTKFQTETKF